MAIHTNWLRAEDVDVIADQITPGGAIYFKVLVQPLVNLIWLAGLVFLLGSVIALWPDPREERRLAARYALARG
jgi:cytochrome c biogenesis factor